jgi:hypothetical protein
MTMPPNRREFTLTIEQLEMLKEATKPLPRIMVGGKFPPTQQERANMMWILLGQTIGFDGRSVQPVEGKGERYFTAIELKGD